MASTSVVFDIIARDRASGAFQKVGGAAKSSESVAAKLGSTFKTVAKAGALAAVAAGAVAVKFGIDAVGAASDLNETISKSREIFGKHADYMLEWADKADTSLGLSKNAALGLTSGFADMFDQIGFTTRNATLMSLEVARLSADLGSFNNLETADVADRMSAAFRGEYDSLQALIPNINAARVEQVALEQTGKKAASALTAQEKAAAVLAIVHKDGAKAQGDFARTSGGLANQQKILKAQLENVQASIGQKLLPVAVKLFTWFNSKGLPALQAFGRYLEEKIPPAVAKVREVFNQAREVLARFTGDGSGKLGKFMSDVKRIFTDGVTIVQNLWRLFGDNILEYLKSTLKNVMKVLSGAFDIIKGVFKTVSALLRGDWRKAWDGIKLILRGALKIVVAVVRQALDLVRFAFKNAGVILKKVWDVAWDGIKQLAKAGASALLGLIKGIPGAIKNLAGRYQDAGSWIISRLVEIMRDKARDGAQWVKERLSELPGKIRELGGNMLDAGKSMMGKLFDGIRSAVSGVGGFAADIASSIKSAINDALNLPFTIHGPGPLPDFTIPAFRNGTLAAPRGLALVGEEGPELMQMRGGERIYTAAQTRGMLGSPRAVGMTSGGRGDVHVHFHGPVAGDPRAFAREVRKQLLQHKRELGVELGLA